MREKKREREREREKSYKWFEWEWHRKNFQKPPVNKSNKNNVKKKSSKT